MNKVSNQAVAWLLREIAAAYEIQGEDRFRIRAYDTAADNIEHSASEAKDLWDDGRLDEIPGVGPSIAQHLDDYFRSGKVKHFETVKRSLPAAMFALLQVGGIGAKSAYKIAKELKLKGRTAREIIANLREAAEAGKIQKLEGFGEKSEQEILRSIGEWERRSSRMLLPIAWELAERVMAELRKCPAVKRVDSLGSLRRMAPTVGDIDLSVASDSPRTVINFFVKLPKVHRVLEAGEKKASIIWSGGRQIDIRVQSSESYGALLQHFTGSKAHNIHLRTIAKERGYSLSEYGIKKSSRRQPLDFATEEDFYDFLGMDWIPPELREDKGEIEAAIEHRLPTLVTIDDIRGDLQTHTTWSDGKLSVAELVNEVRSFGYEYIGITDHQPSIRTLGLERVRHILEKRRQEILTVGQKYSNIRILNGVEVSINSDISEQVLALPDELLASFDYVLASVHTSFRQPKEEMTKRIVAALENPYVKILAHPTGRLLGEREGYEADWEKIFKTAVKHQKFLEINAFPSRLDLPDELIRSAKKFGVRFTLGTDAHLKEQLELLPFGVSQARRGWCGKSDILNTLPWQSLLKELGVSSK